MQPTDTAPKLSHFKRGKLLTKGAWATLRADKELVMLPFISAIAGLIIIGSYFALTFTITQHGNTHILAGGNIFAYILMYVLLSVMGHFFEGALFAGATERFNGGDPTVKSSLAAAKRRIKPLLVFSLFMGTIGLILNTIEQRVPLAGRIAIWLVNASWSVANIFAIPVIMSTQDDISPLEATRESVKIIKKVWGENVIAQFSIGLVALFAFLGVVVFGGVVGGLSTALFGDSAGLFIAAPLIILLFIAVILVFSTLNTIIKAAVYHYAVTGTSPEQFSAELLRQTMTVKKSRKLFLGK